LQLSVAVDSDCSWSLMHLDSLLSNYKFHQRRKSEKVNDMKRGSPPSREVVVTGLLSLPIIIYPGTKIPLNILERQYERLVENCLLLPHHERIFALVYRPPGGTLIGFDADADGEIEAGPARSMGVLVKILDFERQNRLVVLVEAIRRVSIVPLPSPADAAAAMAIAAAKECHATKGGEMPQVLGPNPWQEGLWDDLLPFPMGLAYAYRDVDFPEKEEVIEEPHWPTTATVPVGPPPLVPDDDDEEDDNDKKNNTKKLVPTATPQKAAQVQEPQPAWLVDVPPPERVRRQALLREAAQLVQAFLSKVQQNSMWKVIQGRVGTPTLDDPYKLSFWMAASLRAFVLGDEERLQLLRSRRCFDRLHKVTLLFKKYPPVRPALKESSDAVLSYDQSHADADVYVRSHRTSGPLSLTQQCVEYICEHQLWKTKRTLKGDRPADSVEVKVGDGLAGFP
jgi:hypothetical protein